MFWWAVANKGCVEMRKFIAVILFGLLVGPHPSAADFSPISLDGGERTIQQVNAQTLEFEMVGDLSVEIQLEDVLPHSIAGNASRQGSGTGTLIIRWLNYDPPVTYEIEFSPSLPGAEFTLEGGDGDKRSSKDLQ